jgi:hypothetical protein
MMPFAVCLVHQQPSQAAETRPTDGSENAFYMQGKVGRRRGGLDPNGLDARGDLLKTLTVSGSRGRGDDSERADNSSV